MKIMAWSNRQHMNDGIKAAVASPKTPKHLVPHLAKRLGTNAIAGNDAMPRAAQRGFKISTTKAAAVAKIPAKNPVPSFVNPFIRKMPQ